MTSVPEKRNQHSFHEVSVKEGEITPPEEVQKKGTFLFNEEDQTHYEPEVKKSNFKYFILSALVLIVSIALGIVTAKYTKPPTIEYAYIGITRQLEELVRVTVVEQVQFEKNFEIKYQIQNYLKDNLKKGMNYHKRK